MIVHRIDLGLVGTAQIAAQLQIVGRVGEDQIGAAFRQRVHARDAVAFDDLIQFQHAMPRPKLSTAGFTVIRRDSRVKSLEESKCYAIESPDSSPYKMLWL